MALKVCPECGAKVGVRTKKCACGYVFQPKQNVEPGAWVADKMKGMPDIQQPEPLPDHPLSIAEVRDCVSYEGLGYAIFSLIDPEKIYDTVLSGLWKRARRAMQEIQEYIY
jgi:hypothetical protein